VSERDLETLIREMEEGPETPARARAREIVRAVLELHAGGLARMIEIVAAGGATEAFARDPAVAAMLLLHGLHPHDLETRVRAAVDDLAPALAQHGASVALVAVADGAVRVRVEREPGRGGVPSAALRGTVEQAVVAVAPDAVEVTIDAPDDAARAAFVPVDQVRLRQRAPEARRA
jgi:hypothetical protein